MEQYCGVRPQRGLRSLTEGTSAASTPGSNMLKNSTLKGCTCHKVGDPVRVDTLTATTNRGCSLRSYPRLLSEDAFSVFMPSAIPSQQKKQPAVQLSGNELRQTAEINNQS